MYLAKAKKLKIFLKKNLSLPGRGRLTGRGGFTLMELMMAIGILGIGMVMAASLFPAALKENQLSNDDVIGEMICKNGLNMGKIYYTADTPADKPSEVTLHYFTIDKDFAIDEKHTNLISKANQHYPIGEADASLGYALMARRVLNTAGQTAGYQLICATYRKKDTSKNVFWGLVVVNPTFDNSGPVSVVTVTAPGSPSKLCVGSPIIFIKTGEYATITKVEGSTITLNCKLPSRTIDYDDYAYLLLEEGEDELSPAIFVMSTRTGLKE